MSQVGGSVNARFDPRHNSVNALRLGLALLVLVSHTLKLAGGTDPLGELTGGTVDLGTVAVDGFFALSGFLIARSYLGAPSVWRFLWRRCLRILPAFWLCLVFSAVVFLPLAQLLEYGTMDGFPLTGRDSVLSYVLSNAGLFIGQYEVRGLFRGLAVDGSLYTLIYEFVCYLGIAALGAIGLLRRRGWVVVAAAGLWWLAAATDLTTRGGVTNGSVTAELVQRLGLMFLFGAGVYLWADRVPLSWMSGVGAVALLTVGLAAASLQDGDPTSRLTYLLVAPPVIAYLVVLVGASPRLSVVGAKRDLSYGVYIYAWPVQVLLLLVDAADWPVLVFLATSAAVTGALAWASWTVIEAPALRLKSWTPGWARRSDPVH